MTGHINIAFRRTLLASLLCVGSTASAQILFDRQLCDSSKGPSTLTLREDGALAVTWRRESALWYTVCDTSLAITQTPMRISEDTIALSQRVATCGDYTTVVWINQGWDGFTSYVYGQIVHGSDTLGQNFMINEPIQYQKRTIPDVVYLNDSTSLAVWAGEGLYVTGEAIYGRTITNSGEVSDLITILSPDTTADLSNSFPRLAGSQKPANRRRLVGPNIICKQSTGQTTRKRWLPKGRPIRRKRAPGFRRGVQPVYSHGCQG